MIVAFAMASSDPSGSPPYGPRRYFLKRLTATGKVDRTFGRQGIARLPASVSTMAVAPNGHILLASAERPKARQKREESGFFLRWRFESEELVLADYTKRRLARTAPSAKTGQPAHGSPPNT